MKIYELNKESTPKSYIPRIVRLHMKAFPDFFLTKLGKGFLTTLYQGYLEDKNSGIIVAEDEKGRLLGFIAYSRDYSSFYKGLIKHHLFEFGISAAGAAMRHPSFTKRLLGAFKKSDDVVKKDAYVELASIAVNPKAGGRGVGTKLIDYLKEITDFNKYAFISLETDAIGNDSVNEFYKKNGFVLDRSYTTAEGRKMNEYHFQNEQLTVSLPPKKILYIENVASIFATNFYIAAALAAKELGYEFHIAYNANDYSEDNKKKLWSEYGVVFHQIEFFRKPYDIRNLKAYKQVVDLIKKENIDYIHCNTPIGGVIGRISGHKCKVSRIIYEAHGFHFYKGAPLINWLFFYPIEKCLAHWTDALITINKEDYLLAKNNFHLKNKGKVYYVPGVGINLNEFTDETVIERKKLRESLKLKETDIVCISAGDLIPRKNYDTAIEAIAKCHNKHIQYLICGSGSELKRLQRLAENLKVKSQIHFLGYRSDIKDLYHASDIFLFTTLQEGLPRSMMEAMASGLPCIASDIRGNSDLLEDENGGFLVSATDAGALEEKIEMLASDKDLRLSMSKANLDRIQSFDINTINKILGNIYTSELGGGIQ